MRTVSSLSTSVILLLSALPAGTASATDDVWTGVERIVAVGDVHGGYGRFVRILRQAGVIDSKNRWIGGKTHLVRTGDVVDRGPHSKRVLDLLMTLEREAPASGGRVHFLIGNHEAMRLGGDLTYTHRGEFAEFRTPDAARVREELYRKHLRKLGEENPRDGGLPKPDREYRKKWLAKHPLDRFQFLTAMSPSGRYGSWIRRHNAMVRINDLVFVHGGVSAKYANKEIREINETIRRDLARPKNSSSMATDQLGPLWNRGLARGRAKSVRDPLTTFLERNQARRIVIAHTKSRGGISTRRGGRIILIDVESSRAPGPVACLLIEKGVFYECRDRGNRRL